RLGEGRNADRARRGVDPLFCWREIAERLADSRARLGHQHVRRVLAFARRKDRGDRAGIIMLARTALGAISGQPVEPRRDVGGVEANLTRSGARRRFFPFWEAREQPAIALFGRAEP